LKSLPPKTFKCNDQEEINPKILRGFDIAKDPVSVSLVLLMYTEHSENMSNIDGALQHPAIRRRDFSAYISPFHPT